MKPLSEKRSPATDVIGEPRFLLGVDGGGSKTVALLAALDQSGEMKIIGRGRGGPSNLRLSGKQQSLDSLDQAIDGALSEAGIAGRSVDYAVLALAGSTSPDVQRDVSSWAADRKLSSRLEVVHDALPVLAQGTPDNWGIALIVGTGSVAVGVDSHGTTVTRGGWGHWFGDKGSGFYLGDMALAAVAEASDEMGPDTLLSRLIMEKLGTSDPRAILKEVSSGDDTRRAVAALAPVVIDAAERHDKVAERIVKAAVNEAVKLVAAVAKALELKKPYPLALAGGVVCSSRLFRESLLTRLDAFKASPGEVALVDEPVLGCLKMARAKYSAGIPAPNGDTA
jgi:N-acetylglucosamine kinase-like BadF-type ATPase